MAVIAHLADLHISGRAGDSGATLDDQVDILKWIGNDAITSGAEAFLVAGDVFDQLSSPAERNAAIEVVTFWSEHRPVVIVRGNHDRLADLLYLGRLKTHHDVHVLEHPAIIELGDLIVACIPWPSKAHIVQVLGTSSTLDIQEAAQTAMRGILQGFTARFAGTSRPCVILGHLELGSAKTDSSQPMAGKCEIDVSAGDLLDTNADYIALGHIHKHQVLRDKICYAGSPRQTNFGEDKVKGYCLVEIESCRPPVIKHIRAPGRWLITAEGEWADDKLVFDIPECSNDALVVDNSFRLKYEVDESNREQARQAAEETRAHLMNLLGAYHVKIDGRTIAAYRVRAGSEEISHAQTSKEKMEAYWAAKGERPERAEAILVKLAQIETEVQP
jgi:exonuclease SbcD